MVSTIPVVVSTIPVVVSTIPPYENIACHWYPQYHYTKIFYCHWYPQYHYKSCKKTF